LTGLRATSSWKDDSDDAPPSHNSPSSTGSHTPPPFCSPLSFRQLRTVPKKTNNDERQGNDAMDTVVGVYAEESVMHVVDADGTVHVGDADGTVAMVDTDDRAVDAEMTGLGMLFSSFATRLHSTPPDSRSPPAKIILTTALRTFGPLALPTLSLSTAVP